MRKFFAEENGQDLTEYALLIALVCAISASILYFNTGSMTAIWHATNSIASSAQSAAS